MGVLVGEGQGELPFLSCDLKKTKQPPPQKKGIRWQCRHIIMHSLPNLRTQLLPVWGKHLPSIHKALAQTSGTTKAKPKYYQY